MFVSFPACTSPAAIQLEACESITQHATSEKQSVINRIRSTELTVFLFNRPADFVISQYFEGAFSVEIGQEKRVIHVPFTGTAILYMSEQQFHASQQSHPQSDGRVIVDFLLDSLLEVKSCILSFCCKAEVLGPNGLRAKITQKLRHWSAAKPR
ncbi:MAG TPA: WYL domain-containing protein [Pirellula sp.]|nr:WYL domain-containing protein [Pirellula sp.]